jgi:hypothetical protein
MEQVPGNREDLKIFIRHTSFFILEMDLYIVLALAGEINNKNSISIKLPMQYF